MNTQNEELWQVYSPSTLISAETENHYADLLVQHYQSSLMSNPSAMDFLCHELALDDSDIVAHYRLGFSDRSLPQSIPKLESLDGEAIRGTYQRMGLFKANGHETFRGMLFVPIYNENDVFVGAFGQRIADYPLKKRTESAFVVRHGNEGLFFQHEVLGTYPHLFLCESPFDVMSLRAAGIFNAIGLLDFTYFNDEHLSELLEYNITAITLAFSRTPRGDRYYSHIRALLEGIDIKVNKLDGVIGESVSSAWSKSKMFERLLTQIHLRTDNGAQPTCPRLYKH